MRDGDGDDGADVKGKPGAGAFTGANPFAKAMFNLTKQIELKNDNPELQRDLMRLMQALPIGADSNAEAELRESSNVLNFRLAPEAECISGIEAVDVSPKKDARPVRC